MLDSISGKQSKCFHRKLVAALLGSLLVALTACSQVSPPVVHILPSPQPFYSLKGGGPCVSLGSQPGPSSTNIQVSHDRYLAHSEPMLAEDPTHPLHLVGGSKFFTDPARYRFQIGFFASFDGGCTWLDGGLLPGFAADYLVSDVSFAFGTAQQVYVSVLYTHGRDSGIAVSTSLDGGRTFGLPVPVYLDHTGLVFNDKPWMTVDQTSGPHRGALYVVWSYDHGPDCGGDNLCAQEIAFSRSTDAGRSFSPLLRVQGQSSYCTYPEKGRPSHSTSCDVGIGATPVVTPDGTLNVVFSYLALTGRTNPTRLFLISSSDAGVNWRQPILIATIHDIEGLFPPEKYRNLSLPAFAADPHTGELYVAWSDKGPHDADVLLTSSRDHGLTWSRPQRVNDDPQANGAQQFQPQLAVAPAGVVSVAFFDTRLDPKHRFIDVYLAQSVNGGVTFLPNRRVTTTTWDPAVDAPVDGSGQQFIGDYQGLAADDHFVHPFWNDTRTGSQEIFTAAVPSAHPGV